MIHGVYILKAGEAYMSVDYITIGSVQGLMLWGPIPLAGQLTN